MVLPKRKLKIKSFGELIRQARIKRGLSQRELGASLQVHGQFISNCERGCSSVPADMIVRIIEVLGIGHEEAISILVIEKRKKLKGLLKAKKGGGRS